MKPVNLGQNASKPVSSNQGKKTSELSTRFGELCLATRKPVSYLAVLAKHDIWLCVGSPFLVSMVRCKRESDFHPATFYFSDLANGM